MNEAFDKWWDGKEPQTADEFRRSVAQRAWEASRKQALEEAERRVIAEGAGKVPSEAWKSGLDELKNMKEERK